MEYSVPLIQPKLSINKPGDVYEQEADAMADRVMRMSSNETAKPVTGLIGKSLQRKCAHCEEEEKKKKPIMRKAEAGNVGMSVSSSFASLLNASRGSGLSLPQGTRNFMENAFSADFSRVKIHTGTQASEMSKDINAKAFTYGNDIYFGDGQYSPISDTGKRLLTHELMHTVQQGGENSLQRTSIKDSNLTGWERWYEFVLQAANKYLKDVMNSSDKANKVFNCSSKGKGKDIMNECSVINDKGLVTRVIWWPDQKKVNVEVDQCALNNIDTKIICSYEYILTNRGPVFKKESCVVFACI